MLKLRRAKDSPPKATRTKAATLDTAVSGMRGFGSGIVGTLFANQVRASAGKAGLAGVAAGIAFNMMLKRTPVGAALFGGALLAHQAYKKGKAAQARRDAHKALEKGALAAPAEPKAPKLSTEAKAPKAPSAATKSPRTPRPRSAATV